MTRSCKPSRPRSPRRVELKVEQLENRLTPAAGSVSGIVDVTAPANATPAASPNEGGNAATLDLVVLASVGSGDDVKSIKIENVYNLSVNGEGTTTIHLDKWLKLDSGAEAEIKIEGLTGYKEVGDNPLAFLKLHNDPTIKLNGGSDTGSVELIGTLKITQAGQTTSYKIDDLDTLSSGGDKTARLDAQNVHSIKIDYYKQLTDIATKTEGNLHGKVPELANIKHKIESQGDLQSLKLDSVASLSTDPTSGGIQGNSSLSSGGDLKYLKYATVGTYKASNELAAYKEHLTTAGDLKSIKLDHVANLSTDPKLSSAEGNSSLTLSGNLDYIKWNALGAYKVGEDVTAYKEHLLATGGVTFLTRSQTVAVEPSQGIAGEQVSLNLSGGDTTSASFDQVSYIKFNDISAVTQHKLTGSGEEINFIVNDGNLPGTGNGGGGGVT